MSRKPHNFKLKRFLLVFLALLIIVFAAPWYRFYFASHVIETKIVALDTLEDCNPGFGPMMQYDGKGYGVFDGSRSSIAPTLLGRCGGIQTVSGQYHLVGTYQFYGPNPSRRDLLKSLKVGCTYALRIVGPGSREVVAGIRTSS